MWSVQPEHYAVPEAVPAPRVPQLYAAALFSVSNGDIAAIGVAGRFVSAMYADIGLYYLFFARSSRTRPTSPKPMTTAHASASSKRARPTSPCRRWTMQATPSIPPKSQSKSSECTDYGDKPDA